MRPVKKKDTIEQYHSSEYLGKSQLSYMGKSPFYFKYNLEHPKEPTSALEFGSAFHTYVLEPELFDERYIIMPKLDRRTKEGKAKYEDVLDSGKIVLSEETFETICNMATSIASTKYATTLLNGEHEMSYYWTDDFTDIKCKCRPDNRRTLKEGKGVIVDLKTCRSAETSDFMRDCISYGYDLQAAQYKEGVEKYYGYEHDFVFIAVEKEPPYAVNILQADPLFIQHGQDLFRQYLGMVKECQTTNNWYSFNGQDGVINALGLPPWLAKEVE